MERETSAISDEISRSKEDGQSTQNTSRENDFNFTRKIWNDAGEARAKKLTKETGKPHTTADALQPIAERDNALLSEAMKKDTEEARRIANVIRGKFVGG